MKPKFSPVGYAIILILFVAFVMIFSSPMVVRNYKDANSSNSETTYTSQTKLPEVNEYNESDKKNDNYIAEVERRLNDRLDDIERRTSQNQIYGPQISDKYICSIEGGLDEDGVVVPINPDNPPAKFVFACEYRR